MSWGHKTGHDETLTCTPEHPLYVQEQGWVEAGSLGIGTSIVSRAGPALEVTDLTWQKNKAQELAAGTGSSLGGYTVYNLTVEDDHTFFVGTAGGGTWVHNLNCGYDVVHIVDENLDKRIAKKLREKGVNAFSEEELFGTGTKDPVIIKAMNNSIQSWKMITKNIRDFAPENRIHITGGNATKTGQQVMDQLGPILGF